MATKAITEHTPDSLPELSPAPVLGYPAVEPVPKAGCSSCDSLASARSLATANGDGSARSDCNVKLRRHLREDHP